MKGVSAFVIGLCLYFNPNTVAAYSKVTSVLKIDCIEFGDFFYKSCLQFTCRTI